ncbi:MULTISPECIES: hypothetical protein [Gordonia]|uniref:hypothetical protein n=1 Tax=Gordonia TaxID=2053 RepID=UPI00257C8119|nr:MULTISPECIES: hypothetical protein [Gordonia]
MSTISNQNDGEHVVDGVAYYQQHAQLPPPQTLGTLLIDLGLYQAVDAEQRAGVALWLKDHEPSKRLMRSIERQGFGDLIV